MERVLLVFPDNLTLSEFLAGRICSHAEVDSKHHSLLAPLSTEEVRIACKVFNGVKMSFHHYHKNFNQIA